MGLKRPFTRRQIIGGMTAVSFGSAVAGGYALAEPFRLTVKSYRVSPPGWTPGLALRVAIVTDLHACEPWMSVPRIRHVVDKTNALNPDIVFLLGDYVPGHQLGNLGQPVPNEVWAIELAKLRAPLGLHAVLGNHDWWEDYDLQRTRSRRVPARAALEAAGIPVYENDAVRLDKDGLPFWVAGLGDQWAYFPQSDEERRRDINEMVLPYIGVHDVPATLAKISDDAPVLLMVHEPDVFPEVPHRVSLTFAGHTHGGQVRIAGFAPIVPSIYGRRYVYGHIVEDGRNLVVSGGLGCSSLPVRFGSPPEIVIVDIATGADFAGGHGVLAPFGRGGLSS